MYPATPLKYDLILSHSRADTGWVEGLARRLRVEGCSVRLDPWERRPSFGGIWQQESFLGLDKARCVAICLGREMPLEWFRSRVREAITRQQEDPTFRVVPLLLPEATAIDRDHFTDLRAWVDFRRGSDAALAFHVLLCAIRGQRAGRWPLPGPLVVIPEEEALSTTERLFKYDLFLGYALADAGTVRQVASWLGDAGLRLWFDAWELVPGGPWRETIARAIKDSAAVAVCLGSRGWQTAMGEELGKALGEDEVRHKRLVTLLLSGSSPAEIPPEFAGEVPLDFRQGVRDQTQLHRLLAVVTGSPLSDTSNPGGVDSGFDAVAAEAPSAVLPETAEQAPGEIVQPAGAGNGQDETPEG